MGDLGTKARRNAIVEILRKEHVGTQEELRELVLARGFDVTQATLSRDLQKLRARRVSLPDGGSAYEADGFAAKTGDESEKLAAMHELVTGIREGAAMVVMQTSPGAAPAIAALIDRARMPEIIGTLAGDDTIFIVPEKKTKAVKLKKKLEQLFSQKGISS